MLAETLKEHAVAAAIDAFDGDAVTGGGVAFGELTLEIAPAKIASVCGFLKYDQQFVRIGSVSAVDRHPSQPRFEVVYHLHSVTKNTRLRLKCRLNGEAPEIDSVTGVWRGAGWYEREVFDLFGIRFAGHPDLRRILMPDDFEGNPLRKDFPVLGTRV